MIQQICLATTMQMAKTNAGSANKDTGSGEDQKTNIFRTVMERASRRDIRKTDDDATGTEQTRAGKKENKDSTDAQKTDSTQTAAVAPPQDTGDSACTAQVEESSGTSGAQAVSSLESLAAQTGISAAVQTGKAVQTAQPLNDQTAGGKMAVTEAALAKPVDTAADKQFSPEKAVDVQPAPAKASDMLSTDSNKAGLQKVQASSEGQQKSVSTAGQPADLETSGQSADFDAAVTAESAPNSKVTAEAQVISSGETGKKKADSDPAMPAQPVSELNPGGKVVVRVSGGTETEQASPGGQVANALSSGIKQGKKEFQIELYPQSLGRVSVKLSSEDGVLTVVIAASNPKTQSLLMSSSGEIRSILHSSTGQAVQVSEPQQSTNQNASWYAGDGGTGGQFSQQQQQQQQQRQESRDRENYRNWFRISGASTVSTGDFLTMIRRTAGLQ